MKVIAAFLISLTLFFCTPSKNFAQSEPVPGCEEKNTAVFFVNGIATIEYEALKNLDTLKESLLEKVSTGQLTQEQFDKLEFDIAYNPTGGVLPDLAESIAQDLENSVENVWTGLWKVLFGFPVELGLLSQEQRDEIIEKIKVATLGLVVNEQDLLRHLEKYRKSLLEGKKVLMVSHSQGNFFANAAWNVLATEAAVPDSPFTTASFGIVGVATPADRVGGNGLYSTLDQDKVINAVRTATLPPGVLSPLPHNVILPPALEDVLDPPLHHSFIDAYMHPQSPARDMILAHVIQAINGLTLPEPLLDTGILNATFVTEEDLQIQVREPGGVTISEFNLEGIGMLEILLTETPLQGVIFTFHYTVACADIVPGVYAIDVRDGGRTNPPDEVMLIKAAGQEQTFGDIIGEEGILDWPIAEVTVTDTEGEGNIADYKFEITRIPFPTQPPPPPPQP